MCFTTRHATPRRTTGHATLLVAPISAMDGRQTTTPNKNRPPATTSDHHLLVQHPPPPLLFLPLRHRLVPLFVTTHSSNFLSDVVVSSHLYHVERGGRGDRGPPAFGSVDNTREAKQTKQGSQVRFQNLSALLPGCCWLVCFRLALAFTQDIATSCGSNTSSLGRQSENQCKPYKRLHWKSLSTRRT